MTWVEKGESFPDFVAQTATAQPASRWRAGTARGASLSPFTGASPCARWPVMNEVRVSSWNELQDALFADAWNPELGRFRSRCAYRGLSDAAYPLASTLIRLGGEYARLERHLLRQTPRPAGAPARLDLLTLCRAAFRHRQH